MDRSTRSRNGAIGPVLTHAASTVEAGEAAGVVHMAGGEHIRVWRLRAAELRLLASTLEADPLPELGDSWLPHFAKARAADRDYERRIEKMRKLGFPFLPRVRLATYRSEMEDQGLTVT